MAESWFERDFDSVVKSLKNFDFLVKTMLHLCAMKNVGIGTRVVNFVADTLIIFLISLGLYEWRKFYAEFYHVTYIPWYYIFWGTLVFYYLIFESIFTRTPGKWLSVSKVVDMEGKRPALWQFIVRSVVRLVIIDCFFIPFLDGTLHDFASRTKVVES